jgi:tRNA-2-methylthio-N6-dimethylallyladenosine synthase
MVRPEPREGLMKVYLETMGCQMNRLDSELVAGALRAAGHELVDSPARAEVLLYNTCSVRHHAEQKAHSRLAEQSRRKAASKRRMIIGVLGCMAQREGQALLERYSQLDIVCGPGQLQALAGLITNIADGLREQAAVLDQPRGLRTRCDEEPFDEMDLARDPALTTGPVQAFVRVSQGCDRFCAYCVVPYVRGMQLNRDPARIVEEVRRLVDAGRTEITLLGQTVNAYRWRSGTLTVRFANLLERVSGVAGLRRLRFITSHPADFGLEVLEAMAGLPNVCPYLHLPAQSGSDVVLKRMRRGYTRAQYDELVERAGTIVPGIVLAGDFIVGFPGETEEDHQASADLIRRSGYKNSFIFRYSPRPGTAAAEKLADDVPREVKRRRNSELLAVQAEVGLAHHRRYVGKTVEVLVEGPSPQAGKRKSAGPDTLQLVGRTVGNHIVVFDGRAELAGRYVQVEVVAATPLTLIGSLAASPQQRNRGVAGNEKG